MIITSNIVLEKEEEVFSKDNQFVTRLLMTYFKRVGGGFVKDTLFAIMHTMLNSSAADYEVL